MSKSSSLKLERQSWPFTLNKTHYGSDDCSEILLESLPGTSALPVSSSSSWYTVDTESDLDWQSIPGCEFEFLRQHRRALTYSRYRYYRTQLKKELVEGRLAERKEQVNLLVLQRSQYNARSLSLDVELEMLKEKKKSMQKQFTAKI